MNRILLVDDHPVVRCGIRQILVDGLETVSIGEASDGVEAMAKIASQPWDVVVLDVTLPGASGLDVLKELRRDRPDLPVLVLSMHPAAQFARRVLAAGASGYLTKESAPTDLLHAIEDVQQGRAFVGSDRTEHTGATGEAGGYAHDALSDREYQVLRMIGSGRKVTEIAGSLGLSVKTVSTYRTRLLQKLQMQSSAQLMRYAIENGLVDS